MNPLFIFSQENEISKINDKEEIIKQESQKIQIESADIFNDLRRFEIISFGSMPFVSLDVTLVYSLITFFTNGFDSSTFNLFVSKNYSSQEITGILLTSAGISIGIGLTDLIINQLKRKKIKIQNSKLPLEIVPLEFPDENKIDNENPVDIKKE